MMALSLSFTSMAEGPNFDSSSSSTKKKVNGILSSFETDFRKVRLGSLLPFSTR